MYALHKCELYVTQHIQTFKRFFKKLFNIKNMWNNFHILYVQLVQLFRCPKRLWVPLKLGFPCCYLVSKINSILKIHLWPFLQHFACTSWCTCTKLKSHYSAQPPIINCCGPAKCECTNDSAWHTTDCPCDPASCNLIG